MQSLPIFATLRSLYGFLLSEAGVLIRLAWFPAAVMIGLQIGVLSAAARIESAETRALISLVLQLANLVLSSVIAVQVHRLALFGDSAPGQAAVFRLDGFVWRFVVATALMALGLSVAIGLTLAPVLAAMGIDPQMLQSLDIRSFPPNAQAAFAIAYAIAAYVLVRLSLVFPVIVAEDRIGFGRAWMLSKGQGLKLLALIVLSMVPVLGIILGVVTLGEVLGSQGLTGAIPDGAFTPLNPSFWVFLAFQLATTILTTVIGVAVLSFAYKALHRPT